MTKYTRDTKQAVPLPLQDRVSRIVQSLAGSSFTAAKPEPDEPTDFALEVSEEAVTRVIEAWRERTSYLPRELLADPVWGMLLELLQAEIQGRRVSLSRLCAVSDVPPSSAIRWLKALERQGFAVRRTDPEDAESEFVELSPKARLALRRYFRDIVQCF